MKQGHEKLRICLNDILYLEAMKDYTRIVLNDKQYLVLTTLSEMQERLPPRKFVRIHRSYIVHLDKVTAVTPRTVLVPTHELPIGKLYKHALKGFLLLLLLAVSPFFSSQVGGSLSIPAVVSTIIPGGQLYLPQIRSH